ncbi:MAG: AAA family ATPase [Victivallaceae bacterium]
MDFNEMSVKELRKGVRHFMPETKGVGGLAHIGNKEQLIDALQNRGVMPGDVKEFLAGDEKAEAPDDPGQPELGGLGGDGDGADGEIDDDGEGDSGNESKSGSSSGEPETEAPSLAAMELEVLRQIITRNLKLDGVDEEAVSKIVDAKLKKFARSMVKVIEVKKPDGPNKEIGIAHRLTPQIADVCNLGIHQMLVGPAGGGKTTCCEKVAEILDMKFYPMSVGPQTTKSDLLGFIDAAGNYHTTPLREAFENGGLLLLDEVDAANAGVLTIINSLLANGYCSFPDGIKQRNENFRCICACNTYGRGADRQYVGRNQLDAATLDRFAVVDFDYDEALERSIAGNDAWVDKIQAYRKKADTVKARVIISPRASIFGARLLASGMAESKVEELVVWKGVAPEIKSRIVG